MHLPGLYIHIPFCKSRCIYCDFYSTTRSMEHRQTFVEALCRELELRSSYLDGAVLGSVYIGGGTPSVLPIALLERIFDAVAQHWRLAPEAEITLEANPDDITPCYARAIASLPVNRVSMGVQTFSDAHLRLLNRRHTARQAVEAINNLRNAGIDNISIDLIYDLPNQTVDDWLRNLEQAFALPVCHLSAYALIYEEGTPLYRMREQGVVDEADEEQSLQMYQLLMERAEAAGFLHYEISNFSLPNCEARHNSGYWREMHYLGAGPAAHSYNGNSRRWNTADLSAYIDARGDTTIGDLATLEPLTPQMKQEEFLLTQLRTARGLDLAAFRSYFGQRQLDALLTRAQPYIDSQHLSFANSAPSTFLHRPIAHPLPAGSCRTLCLTRKGLFISDDIISSLFE
ncbi:MAG: radical SAM family heme chaperone HemW [Prevotellaceae bacterium]|nr:radical SAM family heme chaperone HemW [Prevotellaceae bacterium]